jgi:hypothetical protein
MIPRGKKHGWELKDVPISGNLSKSGYPTVRPEGYLEGWGDAVDLEIARLVASYILI